MIQAKQLENGEFIMRFTAGIREKITDKFTAYTFGAQYDALALNEGKLAREVYNTIYSKEERALMLSLPKNWLQEDDSIRANAGGYSVEMHFVKSPLVKTAQCGVRWYRYNSWYEKDLVRYPYHDHHGRADLKSSQQELINRIQAHYNEAKKLDEKRNAFYSKMKSFLKPITSDTKFKELMPEWETVLGSEYFGQEVTPVTALTTTAAEIMCVVAQGRGEKRDGCCDGQVIAL